jgi:hypothetical protein
MGGAHVATGGRVPRESGRGQRPRGARKNPLHKERIRRSGAQLAATCQEMEWTERRGSSRRDEDMSRRARERSGRQSVVRGERGPRGPRLQLQKVSEVQRELKSQRIFACPRAAERGPRISPRPGRWLWATRLAVAEGASVLRSRNSWRRIANFSSLRRNQAARSRLPTLCLC